MKKVIRVVMLPTEQASRIFIDHLNTYDHNNNITSSVINLFYNPEPIVAKSGQSQHLYFLSDEEPQEGDYIYCSYSKTIHQDHQMSKSECCRKIIASTDKYLTYKVSHFSSLKRVIEFHYEGLPRPSNEFIQKYCSLGGIDKVLVDYEPVYMVTQHSGRVLSSTNHIKQQTDNIRYKLKIAPDNTITISKFTDNV